VFSGLQVHAAEHVGKAWIRARRIEHLTLANSEHNSDRLNGSSYEAPAIGVDIHPEAFVNPAPLTQAVSPNSGGL